jgi:hypothetical protein
MSSAPLNERAANWNDHTIPLSESKIEKAEEMSRNWVPMSERRTRTGVQHDNYSGELYMEQTISMESATSGRPKDWRQKKSWRRQEARPVDGATKAHMAEEQHEIGRISETGEAEGIEEEQRPELNSFVRS